MGYSPRGHKESGMAERLHFLFFPFLCHVWRTGLTAHPCPGPSPASPVKNQSSRPSPLFKEAMCHKWKCPEFFSKTRLEKSQV